ncbi:MAG: hypothetical protein IJQ81_15350 [Oscillibacter sp.]|nr:hypothetical protein [Oscillibacter sp.]
MLYEIHYLKDGAECVTESEYAVMERNVTGALCLAVEGMYLPKDSLISVTQWFQKRERTEEHPVCKLCPFNDSGVCTTTYVCSIKAWRDDE